MENKDISQKNVADYYDEFAKKQQKIGLNLRHYKSFTFIKKNGLKRNHKVLEVGCGIGTFTKLLVKYAKRGRVYGTDISPTNIEVAKKDLAKYKHAEFACTDMIDFDLDEKFDFIVMIDVLEHIPVDQHDNLFKTFRKLLNDDGKIYINIPHHNYLDWVRKEEPHRLQIIDQSLSTDLIVDSIYNNDLEIVSLNSHSIYFQTNDYQRIVLQPKTSIGRKANIPTYKVILTKLIHRTKAFFSNL